MAGSAASTEPHRQIRTLGYHQEPGSKVRLSKVKMEVSGPMHDQALMHSCWVVAWRRRMRFLVQALEEERVQDSMSARPVPDFRSALVKASPGTVRRYLGVVPEGQMACRLC